MKKTKRGIALLLSLVLLFSAVGGMTAYAASSYKVYSMKADTYYKTDNYVSEPGRLYKLKLAQDSVVKLTWSGKPDDVTVRVYKNAAATKETYFKWIEKTSGTETFALAEGTYYFSVTAGSYDLVSKYKVSVSPIKNPGNYCRATAAPLKAKTKISFAQTDNYNYDRWYKITLKSKKTVTVETNGFGDRVVIYTPSLSTVLIEYDSNHTVTQQKLAKGTYYIRIMAYFSGGDDYGLGDHITLKWY